MRDTDLESVIVQPRNKCTSHIFEFLFQDMKHGVAVCKAVFWLHHNSHWVANCVVESFDLEAAGVTGLEVGRWEGAGGAGTVETEGGFEMSVAGIGCSAAVVGDGDFFSRFDEAGGVDGLASCAAVPAMVTVWDAAVVDEGDGGVDTSNDRAWPAW